MPDVVVLGFPRSTFVHIARLVLTHKQVPYTFRDLEPEMGSPTHLALHPFNRVPILQHGPHAAAQGRARTRAHEPVDQRRQLLLLPLHDLSRIPRTAGISRARHSVRREGRRACASENRGGPSGLGTRAGAREGSFVGVRSHAGRLLRAAEHVCLRTDQGRTGHVSEIPGLLPMAGEDGGTSDRAKVSCRVAAARSDRACAAMGGFASAQVLIGRRRQAQRRFRSLDQIHERDDADRPVIPDPRRPQPPHPRQ